MASTSDVTEALKYTYGVDQVQYLLNEEVVTWNMFQKMKKSLGGRGQFIMPIMVKNPLGPLSNTIVDITANPVFSLAAWMARLASSNAVIVSMIIPSAPPSSNATICSVKASSISAPDTSPKG